jgi:hypothetical protein
LLPALPGSISAKKGINVLTSAIPMTVPPGRSANIVMEEVLGDKEEEGEGNWEAVSKFAPAIQSPSQHEYDKRKDEVFGTGFGEDKDFHFSLSSDPIRGNFSAPIHPYSGYT